MSEPATTVAMFNRRLAQGAREPFLLVPSVMHASYLEVAAAADHVATGLDQLGLRRGATVGLYLSNRPEWVVACLACWSRGFTVAAVNRLMPVEGARELLDVSDARGVCLASDDDAVGAFALPSIPVAIGFGASTEVGDLADPGADAEAAVLFTSGTTGKPKAFLSSHHRLAEGAREQAQNYASDAGFRESIAPDKVAPIVSFTAFGHIAGLTSLAFALWTGRRFALVDKFSVDAVKTLVEEYHLNVLRLNPAAIYMLATTDVDVDLSKVRYVYSGTAPLSASTRELFASRYGVPILQGYGQSETGAISLSRYDDVVGGREPAGSVGRVLESVTLRIADAEDRPLPVGAEGEIQVKTRDTAVPVEGSSLAKTADGYVHTGDIGKVDGDGFLWITGRMIDKLVVGGFNVFPAEVEEALRRSDLVRDVVVVGLPDHRLGERPVAGVVWRDAPDQEALEQFARELLAAYKVPRAWFDLDAVPLTDRGKVDRREALSIAGSLVEEP